MIDYVKACEFKKDPTFLVTGGAGFIGSNIVEALLKLGFRVRCMDNFSSGYEKNIEPFKTNPNFQFVNGDIRELTQCRRAMVSIDYVLHQAAWGSVPRSMEQVCEYNENNLTGTLNIFEAARLEGVKNVVYASSAAVYGDDDTVLKKEELVGSPLSPYALTKLCDEHYARLYAQIYGLNTVGLRYFNVFGKNQDPNGSYASVIPKFIKEILGDEPVAFYGDGSQTRDFVHVSDVVQANLLCALKAQDVRGQVFNVASGKSISLIEMYDEIRRIFGKGQDPSILPERKGDIKFSSASVDRIESMVGYKARTSFPKGLRDTIDWYKNVGTFDAPTKEQE